MMPAKRRSMADLLAGQTTVENPFAGDPRPGKEAPEPPRSAVLAPLSAAAVPEPRPEAADGPLSAAEQSDLSTCEAALDNLRMAFWAAGKALQAVRDGRLYREAYATFEDYVEHRWDIGRSQAYRLIDAWPLAERLSPIGDRLTESQIRELKPVSDAHGQDAAAIVYETVARTDGTAVTAALLAKVVKILPDGEFDRDHAVAQIRAYLAGELIVRALPEQPPADERTARVAGLATRLQHASRAIRSRDPAAIREAVADVKDVLDALVKIESEIIE